MSGNDKMIILTLGALCTFGGLIFLAISFSTDHWLDYTVNRKGLQTLAGSSETLQNNLKKDPVYFSRHRGLFRTCYEGTADELEWLDSYEPATDIVNVDCLKENGYELKRRETTISYGKDYDTRIQLMRCHFAFFILALLIIVIGCVISCVGCWRSNATILRTSGLIIFLGAFSAAGGMAFFHGYDYLEKQKIDVVVAPEFPYSWQNTAPLDTYGSVRYGYSYYMGWVGAGLSFISAIMMLCAANIVSDKKWYEENEQYLEKPNRAYQYMDTNYAYPMSAMTNTPFPVNAGMNPYSTMNMQMTYPATNMMQAQPMQQKPNHYSQPQATYIDDPAALTTRNIINPVGRF